MEVAAGSCLTRKAMLLSEAEPGGRAFLAAVPAGPKRMEPAVFTAELRHRLGVAEASSEQPPKPPSGDLKGV